MSNEFVVRELVSMGSGQKTKTWLASGYTHGVYRWTQNGSRLNLLSTHQSLKSAQAECDEKNREWDEYLQSRESA